MNMQEAYWRELGIWPLWIPRGESQPVSAADTSPSPSMPSVPLLSLHDQISTCTRCPLHQQRQQPVYGLIRSGSPWMFIGEAPGYEEDRTGQPFVGDSGKLLDQMLHAIGLERAQVSIANVIKCRPPHNRTPTTVECQSCLPYLEQQIAEVRPKVLVLLGKVAAQSLLKKTQTMTELRKESLEFQGIPTIATWHPAYLLRNPQEKQGAWRDLCRARRAVTRYKPT
ncbi:MAG: uracil-DNA glycosylase [Betaproteobacteria bacterium]|nr:uracil-DNA glycosylase [Betaproteobacteria bacterium]